MLQTCPEASLEIPVVIMRHQVLCQIMNTIAARPAETGGILLGPIESEVIDDYYFDATADCSQVTYSPDYLTLRKKMKEDWIPGGRDMKGFVHSHPDALDRLSGGDLEYIRRLLKSNPDMQQFVAPIVIPSQFRIAVFVVRQQQPHIAFPAQLLLD
ncbi:MAG TPA: Mov34/MPN/PAD-1 family protein [Tepidisphaeraceae bacterium]|jgi:proteasome lid subunit RPN8/RPN11|nr:Mov34/MPN/PAD-1 family protein [Tepidisphaeraceae bacterium]